MKLSCRQILALDDDCRLLKICAAVAACNSEGWPLQSTMSTATEKQRGGGPEPFLWDHKLAESHWHSESYTIIIKQLCHSLCPSPQLLLSVTVLIFYFSHENCTSQISLVKIQKLLKTGGGGTKQQPRVKYTESERMLCPLFPSSFSSPSLRGLNELQRQIVAEAILLLQTSTQQLRSTSPIICILTWLMRLFLLHLGLIFYCLSHLLHLLPEYPPC